MCSVTEDPRDHLLDIDLGAKFAKARDAVRATDIPTVLLQSLEALAVWEPRSRRESTLGLPNGSGRRSLGRPLDRSLPCPDIRAAALR